MARRSAFWEETLKLPKHSLVLSGVSFPSNSLLGLTLWVKLHHCLLIIVFSLFPPPFLHLSVKYFWQYFGIQLLISFTFMQQVTKYCKKQMVVIYAKILEYLQCPKHCCRCDRKINKQNRQNSLTLQVYIQVGGEMSMNKWINTLYSISHLDKWDGEK